MGSFEAADPNFAARVRESFGRQQMMRTIGARITDVAPGQVTIELPFREDLTQQHGFLHGGIVAGIADSACGYAALSLMAADQAVLTVEYKVNFLAPARGGRLVARGRVTRPGHTLTVCAGEVVAVADGGTEETIATMLATMLALRERPELRD